MYKAIHLLLITLLVGTHIFNSLIIPKIYRSHKQALIQSTFKLSLTLDKYIIGFLLVILVTGTIIVPSYHWHYTTPWIQAAYLLISIITILWGVNARLKYQVTHGRSLPSRLFYGINLVILVLLLLTIKDAVTKHTWI